MKQTITMLLVFPFLLFFMFQPFMTEIVHMRGAVFENITDKYTKLAAREGYLSNNLRADMMAEIASLHFDTSKVRITATMAPVERGRNINVTLEYPIGRVFIFTDWFNPDFSVGNYKYTATEMSEFIL